MYFVPNELIHQFEDFYDYMYGILIYSWDTFGRLILKVKQIEIYKNVVWILSNYKKFKLMLNKISLIYLYHITILFYFISSNINLSFVITWQINQLTFLYIFVFVFVLELILQKCHTDILAF